MAHLIWTPHALGDVARLYRFLAPKNRDAARRAARAIRQGVKVLAQHPEIGWPVDEMPVEFREWIILFGAAGNLVLYRWEGTRVVILAVRHSTEAGH